MAVLQPPLHRPPPVTWQTQPQKYWNYASHSWNLIYLTFTQNKQFLFCHCQEKTLSSTNSILLLLPPLLPEQQKSAKPHRRDFPPNLFISAISTLKIFLSRSSVFLVPCWKPASFCKPCPTEASNRLLPVQNAIFGGIQGSYFLSLADGACDFHFSPKRSKYFPN